MNEYFKMFWYAIKHTRKGVWLTFKENGVFGGCFYSALSILLMPVWVGMAVHYGWKRVGT